MFLCRCSCGKVFEAIRYNVLEGKSKTCGCSRGKASIRHGMSKSREYKVWTGIKQRCLNPNNEKYPRYGGRGITVCSRWMLFDNFLFDMGEIPNGMSIDRIDNNKGYSKENCRWATNREQSRNKSNNVLLSLNGKQKTIKDWSIYLGSKSHSLVIGRLARGWSIEESLSTRVLTNRSDWKRRKR